jgi:hypothetical protein
MGFGLLSVAPSANAAYAGDDEAASIVSVTVPLVRVADTKTVTVKLGYGTTADTYTVGSDTITAGSVVRARVLSGPTGGTIGSSTVISSSNIKTFAVETTSATAMTVSPTLSILPSVAGTYTLLVWVDESNSVDSTLVPAVTDRQTTATFTTAGTPATVNFASTAKSGKAGQATPVSFGFTLKDAAGNATYLLTGETLSGSVSDVSANTTSGTLYLADTETTTVASYTAGTPRSITVSATGAGSISAATFSAGIARVSIVGSGLLTGVVPAVTADLTTVAYGFATTLALATTTGVSGASASAVAPTDPTGLETTTAGSIWASNVSAKSLTFDVTAAASTSVQYTIAAVSTTIALPTGITAGTYTVTTDTAGDAEITIAATSALASSGYTLTIAKSASLNFVYTVSYQTPIVNDTNGYIVVTPTLSNAAKTLIAGSVTMSATVRDQFGDVASGANVIWTVTGRNASTTAAVTNASGVSTLTIADASASTTALTDTVSVTAASPTATAYTTVSAGESSTLSYVASITVATLTHTNSIATAAQLAAGTDDAAALQAGADLSVTATNAAGVLMSGIPVTFTLPAGAYVTAGTLLTVYTNSSGVATLSVLREPSQV